VVGPYQAKKVYVRCYKIVLRVYVFF
jgi:hypothetical protein